MRAPRPSWTAQHVALARAHLTWRGVLADPFAQTMLRAPGRLAERALRHRPLARRGLNRSFAHLAGRTCYYDDTVGQALSSGVSQVVVLAAGYDSRAWRMERPGVQFFEVDHAATQNDKRSRAPAGGPRYVAAEIGADSLRQALPAAGFDPRAPAVFTIEGLTMYLSEAVVRQLLAELRAVAASRSHLIVNFGIGGAAGNSGNSFSAVRAVASAGRETFDFELLPDEAPAFLGDTGWSVSEVVRGPALAGRYLEGTGLPMDVNPLAFVVHATRGPLPEAP